MSKPKQKRTNRDGISIPQPTTGQTVQCRACHRTGQTGVFCSNCGAVLPTGIDLPDSGD